MRYKVADLSDALLDAAVAKALGATIIEASPDGWSFEAASPVEIPLAARYSRNWGHGGPVIDLELVSLESCSPRHAQQHWCAWVGDVRSFDDAPLGCGPTALVAAMRAVVARHYGEEIELP